MKLTTKIVPAGPEALFRWAAYNDHGRIVLHMFGSKAECDAMEARFKTSSAEVIGAARPKPPRGGPPLPAGTPVRTSALHLEGQCDQCGAPNCKLAL